MSNKQHPKFIMQVNRIQPVPKLVSINDFLPQISSFNKKDKPPKTTLKNKSLQKIIQSYTHNNFYHNQQQPSIFINQQRNQNNLSYYPINYTTNFTSSNGQNPYPPQSSINNAPQTSSYYTTLRKQLPITQPRNYRLQVIQLQKQLQIQRQQKQQLQEIIKQLTVQSQKLKQINEHIICRLKQLQKTFVEQKIIQEKQQDQRIRKVISQVYIDIEEFLRSEVELLTNKLKGQKMTPLLEKKLELFMEAILHINQNTVQMLKLSKKRNPYASNALSQFISNRGGQSLQNRLIDKQNMKNSSMNFNNNNRVSFLQESRQNQNKSFILGKSRNNQQSLSPSQSGRRLINKAYISSSSKKGRRQSSPLRQQIFQDGNSMRRQQLQIPQQYTTILKQLQGNQSYMQTRYNEGINNMNNSYMESNNNRYNTNSVMRRDRNNSSNMNQSFNQRKKYYQTSNYEDSKFHVREYTPNKRKKIFVDNNTNNKSLTKSKLN